MLIFHDPVVLPLMFGAITTPSCCADNDMGAEGAAAEEALAAAAADCVPAEEQRHIY